LIAAALCSIEPVVTEKVVDKERYPKLFSIIFGESLFKDTLSVTFFDSIKEMVADSQDVSYDIIGEDIGFLILRFLEVVVCSILIGVAGGLILTIMFKNWRFLVKEKGISEMALTVLTAFLTYVLSEWAELSGVISMLFCGTVLAHYNSYNLTSEGKAVTL
jgi:sodium/hydrogen exchanger-like protein 6/7/sodium/hydrogen exchanger 8